ncbi:ATP-binding protein [uncultured Kriegella sp.]|uniref:ATP-binding protein n=1 Tax=uncultured Kriegella sp. TaxID=1798910 RepID=UPI0030DA51EF|tara:strand:+ start:163667 stop:165718 length:2052 start_codon:yes stop_codon:yes gene_type:complete
MKVDYYINDKSHRIVNASINAMINLWSSDKKTFWRSTTHKSRATEEDKFYPTVSLRCTESLIATFIRSPEIISNNAKSKLFEEIIPKLLTIDLGDLDSSLDTGNEDDELNEFTLSIYIQTFCRIIKISKKKLAQKNASNKLTIAVKNLLNHSFVKEGFENEHPFILFHAVRALKLSLECIDDNRLIKKIDSTINTISKSILSVTETLLSKSVRGALSPSDNVALAFCSASLSQSQIAKNIQHLISSLEISINSQDFSGCWPMGRVIHENKDINSQRLEISTHEIAWALTLTCNELIDNKLFDNENIDTGQIFEKLNKSLDYVKISTEYMTYKDTLLSGWCSSQPYNFKIIESWTSANVLQFTSSLNYLQERLNVYMVLDSFSVVHPEDNDWPDWLRWDDYKINSETNHDYPILKYLDDNLINIISNHPQNLPSAENRSVSALLFGPPGTSKTTIVKAVADGLKWPIVLLNPGQFIEGGLESIERMARDVFDRLMQLNRTVVIFDECDELFRDRVPSEASEQTRGITAFVTACMLPKLQELHDRGKIVFFICTNNFETIDSAIKRGGRIDHILGVGPPDLLARKKVIDFTKKQLLSRNNNGQKPNFLDKACEKLSQETEGFIRSEILRAVNLLFKSASWENEEEAIKSTRKIVNLFESSLTITKKELSNFKQLNKKFSHNLLET